MDANRPVETAQGRIIAGTMHGGVPAASSGRPPFGEGIRGACDAASWKPKSTQLAGRTPIPEPPEQERRAGSAQAGSRSGAGEVGEYRGGHPKGPRPGTLCASYVSTSRPSIEAGWILPWGYGRAKGQGRRLVLEQLGRCPWVRRLGLRGCGRAGVSLGRVRRTSPHTTGRAARRRANVCSGDA